MRNTALLISGLTLLFAAANANAQSLTVTSTTAANIREVPGFVTATAQSMFTAAARGGHSGNFSHYIDRNTGGRVQGPSGSPMVANTRYNFRLDVTPNSGGGAVSFLLSRANNTTLSTTYTQLNTHQLSHLSLALNSQNANHSFNVRDVTFTQGAFTQVLLADQTQTGNVGEAVWNVTGSRLRNGQAFSITGTVLASGNYNGETGRFRIQAWQQQAVPEPATMAALGLGALALVRKRRAKK